MRAIYENHYLTDQDVANYARQSFGKVAAEFSEAQNEKLIQFLARGMASGDWANLIEEMVQVSSTQHAHELAHYLRSIPEHWVPFGHPHITLRMSAPVPIRTQCFKHKIGYVESEESRRYISSTPKLFVPEYFREKPVNAKQGSGGQHRSSDHWLDVYQRRCIAAINAYEDMIADGICPEQARFVLPQGVELSWVWTGSLYAYANYYIQRSDAHAQMESQGLAAQVDEIIGALFPISWRALTKGAY